MVSALNISPAAWIGIYTLICHLPLYHPITTLSQQRPNFSDPFLPTSSTTTLWVNSSQWTLGHSRALHLTKHIIR